MIPTRPRTGRPADTRPPSRPAGHLPISYQPAGQITARLTAQLHPDDPAWSPPRAATSPVTSRTAATGWPVTGRTRHRHREEVTPVRIGPPRPKPPPPSPPPRG